MVRPAGFVNGYRPCPRGIPLAISLTFSPLALPFVTKNSNFHKQFTVAHGIMPVMNAK
jgi:hypothetical protein